MDIFPEIRFEIDWILEVRRREKVSRGERESLIPEWIAQACGS